MADGQPTADIMRTTVAAGVPTGTLVTGLTGLLCTVNRPGHYTREARNRDEIINLREDPRREFVFIDIPALGGVAANTIQLTDRIKFEGRRWLPSEVYNDTVLGLSIALCDLEDR